ncbi:hypothetical protein CAQU_12055 [Corynebacterium aquilae DSM 44791]|uniref:Uncharacterized protein n=1 Tax=Corynebacterium aquilae DSM 44791 TaxID=1431546 RepID=A0A1L7CIG5_9CORY|nr:hypothetical protein CAQU_12055 [Corynebacterium aquilae DSM 44791]
MKLVGYIEENRIMGMARRTPRATAAIALGTALSFVSLTAPASADSLPVFSGPLAVISSVSTPAQAESPEQKFAREHRDRTILHYGVTTQEDIDKCVDYYKDRMVIDKYFGYDYPCVTEPITKADVEAAKDRKAREDQIAMLKTPFEALESLVKAFASPFVWLAKLFGFKA